MGMKPYTKRDPQLFVRGTTAVRCIYTGSGYTKEGGIDYSVSIDVSSSWTLESKGYISMSFSLLRLKTVSEGLGFC